MTNGHLAHAIPGRLSFEQSPLGATVARLTTGDTQALVALHGAHVLNWTHRGEGLLWLSPIARIRNGKGIRGGVPVCWPWFGDHATDPSKPAHGFARTRAWTVAGTSVDADTVSITLAFTPDAAHRAIWPHAATARLTVSVGTTLRLALETTNVGAEPFTLTGALHTYFRVSDIANVSVTGLNGCAYLDKLEGFARSRQSGPIAFAGEVDRIYLGDTNAIMLSDSSHGRRIAISSAGSASAVVWNPWDQKTARLGDMGSPDAFRQMVCIETANAGDDCVALPPGATHTLVATYQAIS